MWRGRVFSPGLSFNNWIFHVGEEGCAFKLGVQLVKIGFSVQPRQLRAVLSHLKTTKCKILFVG